MIDAGISRWLPQVQQAACEYVVWVLQHASEATMAALAGPALHGTVAALQKLPGGATSAHLPLRGFLYQAVGQLAQVYCMLCSALPRAVNRDRYKHACHHSCGEAHRAQCASTGGRQGVSQNSPWQPARGIWVGRTPVMVL